MLTSAWFPALPSDHSVRTAKTVTHLLAEMPRTSSGPSLHRPVPRVSSLAEGKPTYAKEMLAEKGAALAALGQGNARATGTLR